MMMRLLWRKRMDKIYRRPTQKSNTPKKKKDEHARERDLIINFRVSPREYEAINRRIEMSGMQRNSFFIQSCLYQTILVKGNVLTFDKMKAVLNRICDCVFIEHRAMNATEDDYEKLKIVAEILESYYRRRKS